MSPTPKTLALTIAMLLMQAASHFVAAESLGNLAQYPPERILLTITTADNGSPELDPKKLILNSGQYYRLTINCPDVRDDLTGWRPPFRLLRLKTASNL